MTRSRAGFALLAVAAALLLAESLERSLDRMRASRVLRLAETRTNLALQMGQPGVAIVVENTTVLRKAASLDPAEVGFPIALAGQHLVLGRWDSAIAAYDEALALEPRPETYLNRGRALLGAGRRDESIDDFERAVLLAPFLRSAVPEAEGVRKEVVGRVRDKTGWKLR